MLALSQKDRDRHAQLVAKARKLEAKLDERINTMRRELAVHVAAVQQQQIELNQAVEEVNDWLETVWTQMEVFSEAQPEEWHDSPDGDRYQAWQDTFNVSFNDVEVMDEIEVDDADHEMSDELATLPLVCPGVQAQEASA
jgi:oligoendopeptidase F